MTEHYTDLRIVRTKESIRAALIALIEEKGFDAITVKDITTKAKINRGTFYAHYENKFDLMTKLEDEFMQTIAHLMKQNTQQSEIDLPMLLQTAVFDYLHDSGDFLHAVLGPKGNVAFQTRLKDFMMTMMFEQQKPLIHEDSLLVSKHYVAAYIASAHIGVIQKWLETGRKESPEEIAQFLATVTVDGALRAVGEVWR